MRTTINGDQEWGRLKRLFEAPGAIPRRSVYGSSNIMVPFGEAYTAKMLDPKDFKESIQFCHENKIFPMYHSQDTWRANKYQWNQNGLNYCWAYGLTGAMMTRYALEGRPTVLLAPTSLGWLVRWRNAGYYLEETIRGATEKGICEMSYTTSEHAITPDAFKVGWEDNALTHRLNETWDSPNEASLAIRMQYTISILATGTPLYAAYNWWSHAIGVYGVIWDENERNNLRVVVCNSHNEDDLIELTGDRAIPDEQYGICSTYL